MVTACAGTGQPGHADRTFDAGPARRSRDLAVKAGATRRAASHRQLRDKRRNSALEPTGEVTGALGLDAGHAPRAVDPRPAIDQQQV